ncbi:MAG: hypothetical protein P8Z71_08940 [Candidatus Sulfobium sp.]
MTETKKGSFKALLSGALNPRMKMAKSTAPKASRKMPDSAHRRRHRKRIPAVISTAMSTLPAKSPQSRGGMGELPGMSVLSSNPPSAICSSHFILSDPGEI